MHKLIKMASTRAESVGMSIEGLNNIDKLMQKHTEAGDIQGGVTLVARQGKVVHFSTHGEMDVDKGRAMEPDAIFIMASSAKPVIAVAALMLVDEGLISLSDPVSKYIPEFAEVNKAVVEGHEDQDAGLLWFGAQVKKEHLEYHLEPVNAPITIHQLLTHTSGYSFGGPEESGGQKDDETLADYVNRIALAPLHFQPGTRWGYGNVAIHSITARIIEIASGSPFEEFMRERVFAPLQMNRSYFTVPSDKQSKRVMLQGFDVTKKNGKGLCSAAEDFLHFNQMLLNGGELFGQRLLRPETVKMMSSNQVGDLYASVAKEGQKGLSGMGFGHAVAITMDPDTAGNHRGSGSFGWGGAGGTESWVDPEHELVVVRMLQQERGGNLAEVVEQALIA